MKYYTYYTSTYVCTSCTISGYRYQIMQQFSFFSLHLSKSTDPMYSMYKVILSTPCVRNDLVGSPMSVAWDTRSSGKSAQNFVFQDLIPIGISRFSEVYSCMHCNNDKRKDASRGFLSHHRHVTR